MIKKKVKTETETIRENNVSMDGSEYFYELVMKKSKRVASYRLPLYSIRVRMIDPDGNLTKAELTDAFADIGRAVVFYQKMVDNLVTPIDLPYIHEDELYAERIGDGC